MAFSRTDMYYKDYKWSARNENDDPRVRGGLDHTANDKTEGYEVLYFVNACARDWGWSNPSTTDYQKIERMLRIVPGHLRQQAEKKAWIAANWSTATY
jgi:hypothetical protein